MLSGARAYVGKHHVGLLALFIALGGTSYAAIKLPANSVGAKQLKKGAVTPPKVSKATRRLFKGQKGARGARGPTGARGATGASGAPGSPSAGAVFGLAEYDSSGGSPVYSNPSIVAHGSPPENGYLVEASPNTAMVARDLFVTTSLAPGGIDSRTVTLRVNRTDTALKCTIFGVAVSCNSGSATVAVPAGSILSMKLEKSSSLPNAFLYWGFRLTTP